MYLSQLSLNPRNAQIRSELARPYEMHRTLSSAFQGNAFHQVRNQMDAAGILFRVDESPRDNRIVLLVQSQAAPNWMDLGNKHDSRGYTYLLQPAEFKAVELHLLDGQRLAFRLRANPTKRLSNPGRDKNGKRVGIYDEAGQLDWLARKGEAGGFRVVRAMVSHQERINNSEAIRRDTAKHDLKMLAVQFDGILQVVNANLFSETIARGIGSGKAFGFGLLSLARN